MRATWRPDPRSGGRETGRAVGAPDVLEIEHAAACSTPERAKRECAWPRGDFGRTEMIVRRARYVAYMAGLPLTAGHDMVGIVDQLGLVLRP